MSDRDTKLIRQARSTLLSFPDAESKQAWLPLLHEAYAIVDAGIHEAIRREAKQGRTLACHSNSAKPESESNSRECSRWSTLETIPL